MRMALSLGLLNDGLYDEERGVPEYNEWDAIFDKNRDYIKNFSGLFSWGQDTVKSPLLSGDTRVMRGFSYTTPRPVRTAPAGEVANNVGFRPALEISSSASLDYDALKSVTFDIGGYGTLGDKQLTAAVVYIGKLTLPYIKSFQGFNRY